MRVVMKAFLLAFPIGVIVFCCWFFRHVFDRTMAQCENESSVVRFSFEENFSTNVAFHTISKDRLKEIISEALTDRAEIAEKEHDKFRAELATWLSVFGLLSIIATLVVPVCAYLLQQREIEKVQFMQEEQKKSMSELKGMIDAQAMKFVDMEKKVSKAEEAKTAALNSAETAKSVALDAAEAAKSEAKNIIGATERPSESGTLDTNIWSDVALRSMLYEFKLIWGTENLERKIQAGITLFEECSKEIGEALNSGDKGKLVKCINILHNVDAYIGTRNLEKFRPRFVRRLQEKRPIQHSPEQISKVLDNCYSPQLGYFKKIYDLQS